MPSISGRHDRRQVLVEVILAAENPRAAGFFPLEPLTAIFDTGATSTSITRVAAQKLGLPAGLPRQVKTAGSVVTCRTYDFRVGFQIGGAGAPYVLPEVVSGAELGLDRVNFDILLGMDIIAQGDLTIRRTGAWTFEF